MSSPNTFFQDTDSPVSSNWVNITHDNSSSNDSAFITPTESSPEQLPVRNRQQNGGKLKGVGRKGHTKSRRGCYNCKKARIKCKENSPACDYCNHRNLYCVYPSPQINMAPQPQAPEPQQSTTMQLAPIPVSLHHEAPVFNMRDFRLFDHFIKTAYPHHPVGNDDVWTRDIPSLASDYDFLLYSMLALSASDLADPNNGRDIQSAADLTNTALNYRVKAITALKRALSAPQQSFEQGNAMLATCFSLLFQSVLLDDGLIEYMTFIRGVIAVSVHMGVNQLEFIFKHMYTQQAMIETNMQDTPLIDAHLVHDACRSIEAFAPLVSNPREVEYYGHLLSAARDLFTSSSDAYTSLTKIYALFSYHMSHVEFALFISPTSEAGKLLQSHFAALQLVMTPITLSEKVGGRVRSPTGAGEGTTARWLTHLHKNIRPDMERYYAWPKKIERGVREGTVPGVARVQFRGTVCGDGTDNWG